MQRVGIKVQLAKDKPQEIGNEGLRLVGGKFKIMINGQIYSADLPDRDKVVYLYLKERCGKDNECFPAMKTIAGDLCICRKTVQRAVIDLIELGYIQTEQRWRDNGGRSTLVYRIMR